MMIKLKPAWYLYSIFLRYLCIYNKIYTVNILIGANVHLVQESLKD